MLYRGRNKREFYLASLLYDSIEYQHIESVTSLLTEKGADPNLVLSKKGISPFHLAVGCQSYDFALEVISLILRHGGNPNVRSDDGLTPVHIAAAWGRIELLELLLKNGGDPTIRDVSRKNPLHYALEEGYTDCLNLLKCYLPAKNDLIKDDEDTHGCCLILDKIIVQTGLTVGEYVVTNEETETLSITPPPTNLQSLPQTNTTDYVLSWVSDQQIQKSSYLNAMGSVGESLDSSTSFDCSDESLVESDGNNEAKRYDPKFITFRKTYRKTRSKSKSPKSTKPKNCSTREMSVVDETFYTDAQNATSLKELSRESGVVTIPSSTGHSIFLMNQTTDKKNGSKLEKSSDYFTCSHNNSINSLERNIFEITEDLSALNVISVNEKEDNQSEKPKVEYSNEHSFVSVSEVYKYVDEEENVVLYEKRYLSQKTSSECARSPRSSNASSLSSLPPTFDYDTDTLKQELTQLGFNPGPITSTTKRIYLKKLHHLKEHPKAVSEVQPKKRVYSRELEKCLRNLDWCNDPAFRNLEGQLLQQFGRPSPSVKWREGNTKSSFTYLLLDPRITGNLPHRSDSLTPLQTWHTFLSAIFYVGKGKRSRPYQHLYDAVELWKKGETTSSSTKLQRILNIWESGSGVVCLHVFLNIIPVEAYTREAAMISAITLDNLTNVKGGEFYGVAATWPQIEKKKLGVYLLHKAMMIFLHEGERQLCPTDID